MPYYLYKIFRKPILRLEKLEKHEIFREANNRAKALRSALLTVESCEVKLIFAENELGAEDLLSQIREPAHEIEDD